LFFFILPNFFYSSIILSLFLFLYFFYKVANSAGLDVDLLKQDMSAPDIEQALKANLALANALNIHGTPGFIIGNHIVPGAVELDTLKSMVADARKG